MPKNRSANLFADLLGFLRRMSPGCANCTYSSTVWWAGAPCTQATAVAILCIRVADLAVCIPGIPCTSRSTHFARIKKRTAKLNGAQTERTNAQCCRSGALLGPGWSSRNHIFFLLRTALKDHPRDHQPPTANSHQPPTATNRQPPSATNRRQPPAATNCQPPNTTNHYQPPITDRQPQPTTTNCHQPPVANCQPPIAANRQPPTATNHG